MRKLIIIAAAALLCGSVSAQNQSLDALLEEVRRQANNENVINREREAQFRQQRSEQQRLLREARAELAAEERRSDELKNEFDQNEMALAESETILDERMGNLKELFAIARQVAGDARGQFDNSIITAQFPDRSEFLLEIQEQKAQPSLEQLTQIWFELQREITEQGKVVTFSSDILNAEGEVEDNRQVTRVGVFNAVSDGKFLQWQEPQSSRETGNFYEQRRQPASRYLSMAEGLEQTSAGQSVPMAVDFSRGAILRLVVETKTWLQRVQEDGGPVGYVIIGIGLVGLLIALLRAIVLYLTGAKMNKQLKSDTPNNNNPLGRVMSVYTDNPDADVETLELKLDEAILRESGTMESGLSLVKVLYVVAPLLGLLGTVVGMIATFQAITLFGTGDPKTMAGGISQALVTTVLGLVVAIPLTLIHSLLAAKARRMVHVLEEQAAGIVAMMAER